MFRYTCKEIKVTPPNRFKDIRIKFVCQDINAFFAMYIKDKNLPIHSAHIRNKEFYTLECTHTSNRIRFKPDSIVFSCHINTYIVIEMDREDFISQIEAEVLLCS